MKVESFELAGIWWLPGESEKKDVGIVKYSDESGFRLQIPFGFLGKKDHFNRHFMDRPDRIPIIHGFMRDGKHLTLVNSFLVNESFRMPGAESEEYSSFKGFIGDVVCDANPLVDSAHVSYSYLRDWVILHPSELKYSVESEHSERSIDYHYKTPEDLMLASGDGWRVFVNHTAQFLSPSVKGFHLEHECKLSVELEKPLAYDELTNHYIIPIWQFLSFCLDRSINVDSLMIMGTGSERGSDHLCSVN